MLELDELEAEIRIDLVGDLGLKESASLSNFRSNQMKGNKDFQKGSPKTSSAEEIEEEEPKVQMPK